jgi:acyl carrier protein
MTRAEIHELFDAVRATQGKTEPVSESASLREIGFRSLDFSELALRVEERIGSELNFEAPRLRAIETVGDAIDFLEEAAASA